MTTVAIESGSRTGGNRFSLASVCGSPKSTEDTTSRMGGDREGAGVTGGGVSDAIDGLLRGVNERSNSELISTGECMECGEFGELPEGDKGGVCVPAIS